MFDLINVDSGRNAVRNETKSPKEKLTLTRKFVHNPVIIKELENINFNEKDEIKRGILVRKLMKLTNEKLKKPQQNVKRDFKTNVELFALFIKLSEIENIKQRFQAEVYIEATWEDNSIKGDSFDPDKYWTPDLFIENSIGAVKQDIKYKIVKKNNKTFVCEMRNVKGTFYETLELNDFPLDIQDVTVTVTTNRSIDEIEFQLSTEKESSVSVENFRMKQEWKLYSILLTNNKEYTDLFKKCKRPGFSFSGKIARRPGYYLNNAYLLMCKYFLNFKNVDKSFKFLYLVVFITALGFMPFSFAVNSPSSRIGSTVMLILSSINFKIAVTTRLPTVSYLTVLDKYGMTALIYLAVLCFYHSIIGSSLFSSTPFNSLVFTDRICLGVFGGLFILFHLAYIPYFIVKFSAHKTVEPKRKPEEITMNEKSDHSNRALSANSIIPFIDDDPSANESKLGVSLDSATFFSRNKNSRDSISSQSNLVVREIKVKPKANNKLKNNN